MTDEQATQSLVALDGDDERLRLAHADDVRGPLQVLLDLDDELERIVLLDRWVEAAPRATVQLLAVAAREGVRAVQLGPTMARYITQLATSPLIPVADEILATAFPNLEGVYREVAAERPAVQHAHGLAAGRDFHPLPDVAPTWRWPGGTPFPSIEQVEGVQARLNWLEFGSGPIDGELGPMTLRALARWQLFACLEPTGTLDEWSRTELAATTPDAS